MKVFLIFSLLLLASNSLADPLPLPPTAVSINLLWPLYPGKLHRISVRHSLHQSEKYRTEAIVGLGLYEPNDRETEGRFSEKNVVLAVKQFLASPWHVQFETMLANSRLENHVTTKETYKSNDVLLKGLFGYEWMLGSKWSLEMQAGVGKVVYKSNPWPIFKDDTLSEEVGEQVFPVAAVEVSYWF